MKLLGRRLAGAKLLSYDLHYCTGAYPEGDALLDLYIHPLDLVCHLFGPAEILSCQPAGRDSYILMLKHGKVSGTMELSTCYGWSVARETLSVNTGAGLYRLEGTEKLSFEPRPAVAAGIPLEKIGLGRSGTKVLFERNSFSPVLKENPVYIQGFFDEVRDFAQCTQGRRQKLLSSLESIRDTYKLIEDLRKIQP